MSGLSKIKTGGLHTGCVSADAIATGAVTAADIPDGEISHVKLAADCVDGDNIADDVVLGGNPTTTTQSASNNSTRIATTAYVDTAVGNLSQDSMTEGNTKAEVVDTGSDGHFKVETEGTERLRVIADGKVGIGTATPSCELEVSGTGAVELPQGTTAQRPSATAGMLRYNSSNSQFEYSEGNNWYNVKDGPIVTVDYLVIAGGGPGSAAGTGSYGQFNATAKGSDSTFHTITSAGCFVGGGTTAQTASLLDGGSGGGGQSGGGAGGYRTSFGSGSISGGNSAVEDTLTLTLGTPYDLSVGAGGAKATGTDSTAKAGGSGVIILRTEAGVSAAFSAGVVVNGTTVSSDNTTVAGAAISGSTDLCWTVTAAASDTVTFS